MTYNINSIFEEYEDRKKDIEISIEDMKKSISKYIDKIVLYGAGSAGIAFMYYLNEIGINPRYFVDGNPAKHGSFVEGLEVISIEDIKNKVGIDALVVVTINTDGKRYCKSFDEALRKGGHTGVHKNLSDAGYENVIDYTWFRRCHKMFKNDKYNLPSCSDVDLMVDNKDKIIEVFNMLEDEMSKEVFYKIVKFRMIDDSITVPTLKQDDQYFEYDIYKPVEDEVFVDCGAFNGITLNTFLRNNKNKFDEYYAIEPDEVNYKKLEESINSLDLNEKEKIKIYFNSVYDKDTEYIKLYELKGPGTFVSDIGKYKSKTIAIDNMLNGKRASMIKMNIEGSEINALKGAQDTISKYKPVLAIASYHKTWDLWGIPLLIKKYYSGYRLFFRSYMNHISFVCYAVPEGR